MKRLCLSTGCGVLVTGADRRCPSHKRGRQRVRDAIRGTASERGYDSTYRRLRRLVLASGEPCVWCGGPADTADHLQPLSRGGQNTEGNLVPACRACNYSRGGRLARR